MIQYQEIIDRITREIAETKERGHVATYIPELAGMDTSKFGIAVLDFEGNTYRAGDADEKFSIQSISKVLALAMAYNRKGEKLWRRVDVEPSGDPYNDLGLLENEHGIPRNPLINPGAIVICDILLEELENPRDEILAYIREVSDDQAIDYNPEVANSERNTGYRNYAAANLIKSFGNLNNEVDDVLNLYFDLCSIEMSCAQLARSFYPLMNRGKGLNQKSYLKPKQVKRINAIMLTCGFYDEAGEFAFEIGLPGKSGVGGGIVAVLPKEFTVATWSPGLNDKGNSKLGMQALERLTSETGLSIF